MKNKIESGFTLIELLIVVAIVAILSVVGMSSYKQYAMESRRSEAKTTLFEVMGREQKYLSENNTYVTDLTQLGESASPLTSQNGYYLISAAPSAAGITDGVILTATPQGVQATDTCGAFVLNSNGQKTTLPATATGCW